MATLGPGHVNPPPAATSSTLPPGLPLSPSPDPSVITTTLTLPDTTITFPVSTNSLPTGSLPPASSTSTPASSAPSSSPTDGPVYSFSTPANATTCEPLQIQWTVSNANASPPANGSVTHVQLLMVNMDGHGSNTTIAPVPLLASNYVWSAVTVPQGLYTIQGVDSFGLHEQSDTFSVATGSNTTCLSSASGNGTSSSSGSNSGAASSSSSHSGVNKGAIAGGVVGGLLLAACAAIAFFFLSRLRKQRAGQRASSSHRTWGAIGSLDSKTSARSRGSADAAAAAAAGDSRAYLSAASAARPRHTDSLSSLEAEKLGAGTTTSSLAGHDPQRDLPTLAQHPNWSLGSGSPPQGSVELARLSSRTAPATTAFDSPRSSTDDPFFAPTPNATANNNRRSSRTPRKPVPAYTPTPAELEEMAMARTRSENSSHASHASFHTAPPTHHPSSSYSTSASHTDVLVHGLQSKSSGHFREGQLHYIMPDMPPERRAD